MAGTLTRWAGPNPSGQRHRGGTVLLWLYIWGQKNTASTFFPYQVSLDWACQSSSWLLFPKAAKRHRCYTGSKMETCVCVEGRGCSCPWTRILYNLQPILCSPPKYWGEALTMITVIRPCYSGETNNAMLRTMGLNNNGATFVPGSQCYKGHG